jgi:hypothetical protein
MDDGCCGRKKRGERGGEGEEGVNVLAQTTTTTTTNRPDHDLFNMDHLQDAWNIATTPCPRLV